MKRTDRWLPPYDLLLARHGPQHWWPGETPFEVMVGAVLTQNTAWSNVEKAIANLNRADALDCRAILSLADAELAELIRPAGYFNVKARRLKALCRFLAERGVAAAPEALAGQGTLAELRRDLLAVHGIGEETADSILLYALGLASFVVDAYTRRAFGRLGLLQGGEGYGDIQRLFEGHVPRDVALYNEYHALIVRLGKEHCRPKPRCADCPLNTLCPHAS
ncbi:MAG: endonuclease III domain-containing protein [Gallionellaceae bacterium]|nr:endonuclease III domain-containing protein [Gallionellaceae bacterium]